MPGKALPRARPFRIINLVGVGIVLSLLGDGTLYTVLPKHEIASQAGLTLGVVGVVLGVNRLVRLLFNPAAGVLYDRLPRRGMLVGSMILGAASTAIYAATRGTLPMLIGRAMWGAAWSGLWIGANSVVLDLADQDNRGRLSARLQMWFFVGAGTASLFGGGFTDLFGFRGGLWLSALLTASAAVLWWAALPETGVTPISGAAVPPEHLAALEDYSPRAGGERLKSVWRRIRLDWKALREIPWRDALPAAVPVFAIRFVFAGVIASTTIIWLAEYVGDGVQIGAWLVPLASLTGAFSSMRTATSIGASPMAGWLSDRLRRRWPVIAAGLATGAVGLWLMGSGMLIWAVAGAALAAVANGTAQVLAPAIAGDRIEAARHSRALSVLFTIGDLGSALGPPLALGLLEPLTIRGVYLMAAGVLLVVAVLSLTQIRSEIGTRDTATA